MSKKMQKRCVHYLGKRLYMQRMKRKERDVVRTATKIATNAMTSAGLPAPNCIILVNGVEIGRMRSIEIKPSYKMLKPAQK